MILFNLIFRGGMSALWRQVRRVGPAPTTKGAWLHSLVGVAVLVLVGLRPMFSNTRGVPEAPVDESRALKVAGDAGDILP